MKKTVWTLIIVLFCLNMMAEAQIIGNFTATKLQGGTKPATCNAGPPPDVWVDTGTSPWTLNVCTSGNTWNAITSLPATCSTNALLVGQGNGNPIICTLTPSGLTSLGVGNLNLSGSTINVSGGSSVTLDATGDISLQSLATMNWNGDAGISRNSSNILRIGNGTQNDASGTLQLGTVQLTNINTGASSINVQTGGTNRFFFNNAFDGQTSSTGCWGFTNSSDPTAALTTGICPVSSGVLGVASSTAATTGGTGVMTHVAVGTSTTTSSLNLNGTFTWSSPTAEIGTGSAVCYDNVATTNKVSINSAVATCTISSLRFKEFVDDFSSEEAKDIVQNLHPAIFRDKSGVDGPRFGFAAEEVDKVDTRLVDYEQDGRPRAVDYERYTAVLTKALQAQEEEIQALRKELKSLTPKKKKK
jgi:hypothetical protein